MRGWGGFVIIVLLLDLIPSKLIGLIVDLNTRE